MISIVTITFNNYAELIETLRSVQEVPRGQFESIVINGGSCKETKEFLKDYPGIVVNEPDQGISDALNKGLRLATGKGVMFLNSGDILIEKKYPAIASEKLNEYDFVHSDIIFDDPITGPIHFSPAFCNPGRGMPYFHQSMIVNKSFMNQVGEFDLNYKIAMDYDYVIRMHKMNAKGYYYRDRPTIRMDGMGISATQENKSLSECLSSMKKNNVYTLSNRFGFCVRKFNLSIRMFLMRMKMKHLLMILKKAKHLVKSLSRKIML